MKPSFFSDQFKPLQRCEKAMGWCSAPCKMLLLCVQTIVKESYESSFTHACACVLVQHDITD